MFSKAVSSLVLLYFATIAIVAQVPGAPQYQSQEISEDDGVPVLIKHLPDWQTHKGSAVFAARPGILETALGERPVLRQIDWTAGTEAVTAPYDAGKLLIIEYTSPQASSEADQIFTQVSDPSIAYRRIGNYNVFVFDASDPAAANSLLDQVKYEKQIQWLGNNPFRISAERAFVLTTGDIFLSTVIVIIMGIGVALVGGVIVGFVYFNFREKRRGATTAFTDAGGMTRLNLDGFTPDIAPHETLLGE